MTGLPPGGIFDGTGITAGTDRCRCAPACDFPCWQRIGIAPPCPDCGCDRLRDEAGESETIRFRP